MSLERPEQLAKAKKEEDLEQSAVEGGPERQRVMEEYGEKRAGILRRFLSSETSDLVPVLGGLKMTVEGAFGEKASGEKLTGKERVVRTGVGLASTGLDLAAVGEIGKGAILAGRSVVFLEKMGARLAQKRASRSVRIIQRTKKFMEDNPEITRKMEQLVDEVIRGKIEEVRKYRQRQAA